ncbi:MAG: hypothetical protein ABR999_01265 [Methanoregula sp.]|jgi:hypothetical protein|uniref:hypothetical protein n=1 Tax=Methanoregula sp. TaxID=2052170 RepID=UPI003D144469
MTGKNPPERAIAEAQRWAGEQGLMVFALEPLGLFPFHFVINDKGTTSVVSVRHPRYLDFNLWYIDYSCRVVIKELRALTISKDIRREIWVRRNAQTWYRYLVLPETLEYIEDDGDGPDKNDRHDGGGESPSSLPL